MLILVLAAGTTFAKGSIFDDDFVPPVADHASPNPEPATAPTTLPAPPDLGVALAPHPREFAPIPTPPTPRQIPAKPELATSRKLLKTAFAEQMKDHSASARRKLAATLLEEAEKPGNSVADQFALMTGAFLAAKEGNDLPACVRAADRLGEAFPVDSLKLEADAAVATRAAPGAEGADNVRAGLQVADSLARAQAYGEAFRVLGAMRTLAGADRDLRTLVTKRTQSLESARAAAEAIKPTLEGLKKSPDDPAANLAVGEYYCLRLGQWSKGLPHLIKGSDKTLEALATAERDAAGNPASTLTAANNWWDRAEVKGTREADARAIKVHAGTLYRAAKTAVRAGSKGGRPAPAGGREDRLRGGHGRRA